MGRHAIKTPPHHAPWADFLDVWREADGIPIFESAWTWDHFYPLAEPFDGPNLEGWTMLGALAQATSRIRIGAMVNGMHHRHPAVTANMAATLDHISGGRFELGIGAGWNEMESSAYGIELGTLKQRSDRFEEGVQVIESLLTSHTTTFEGEWYRLTDAWCEPKPVQERIPIVVGGKGRRRTLRTAARFADQWDMTFPASPAEWVELDAVLCGHCEAVGRDPAQITRSVHLAFDEERSMQAHAEEAAGFFEVGVDVVVWSMRGAVDPARLEPLAIAVAM
ncbi:MAG: TIGR03560 family F420-dependent LLM class oxidoreductase [Ilumatobacter sp.]|uniref:TIGR03560 family F420-dependent LLM class oxidoreductase n=1 Tax=Ilumatobacter sp. TaxID=1967498 RepID=UPI002632A5BF|nr:TIGR03560 family F420-dependent LLM class oxidoreductase [Ilumatobacter sp.]MDJ0767351.1 TIGR03560 family F420-dependent LLM class oxidoreductase [Ilumatobacter sp.]